MDNRHTSGPSTESHLKSVRRTRFRRVIWILILAFLLVCVLYPVLKTQWAKRQVQTYCSQVTVGMAVDGLEKKARELGLEVISQEATGSGPARIMVWEGWAFARWFCTVDHIDGKVAHKSSAFLD
jgi:hypothetical protein